MNASLNIEDFSALLDSDTEGNAWIEALRRLVDLEDPEKIMDAFDDQPLGTWS